MKDDLRLSACAAKLDEKRKIIKGLMEQNAEMLAALKQIRKRASGSGKDTPLYLILRTAEEVIIKMGGKTE